MLIADLFSGLSLHVARVPFVCAAFMLSTPTNSFAEDAPPRMTELHFGRTTVALGGGLVLSVNGGSKPLSDADRKFDIPVGTTVQVALPTQVLGSFSPPCEAISSIMLTHGALPSRADNPLFNGLQPRKTKFDGVSKLEATSGRPLLELYQFDSDQLRDFWGDQINFYKSGTLVRLKVQITRDLRIEAGTAAKECFFERGEIFVTQLRAFIDRTIKSH